MKLPKGDHASISREKLLGYILSETHSMGKFKARLFCSLGFNERNVDIFEKALLKIANEEDVKDVVVSVYGTKYILDGIISTSKGKSVMIRTIWIVEKNKTVPRLVTLYPVK